MLSTIHLPGIPFAMAVSELVNYKTINIETKTNDRVVLPNALGGWGRGLVRLSWGGKGGGVGLRF